MSKILVIFLTVFVLLRISKAEILAKNGIAGEDCSQICERHGYYPLITQENYGSTYYYCLYPYVNSSVKEWHFFGGWNRNGNGTCYTPSGDRSSSAHTDFYCFCNNQKFLDDSKWLSTYARNCSDVCTEGGLKASKIGSLHTFNLTGPLSPLFISRQEINGIKYGGMNFGTHVNNSIMTMDHEISICVGNDKSFHIALNYDCFCYR